MRRARSTGCIAAPPTALDACRRRTVSTPRTSTKGGRLIFSDPFPVALLSHIPYSHGVRIPHSPGIRRSFMTRRRLIALAGGALFALVNQALKLLAKADCPANLLLKGCHSHILLD